MNLVTSQCFTTGSNPAGSAPSERFFMDLCFGDTIQVVYGIVKHVVASLALDFTHCPDQLDAPVQVIRQMLCGGTVECEDKSLDGGMERVDVCRLYMPRLYSFPAFN